MPNTELYRHQNELIRALAGYAVSLHPFHAPPDLFQACTDFVAYMKSRFEHELDVLKMPPSEMQAAIFEFCNQCPSVVQWNTPKSGHTSHVFTSRYGGPKPEHDFIDLDALAGNVARQLRKED